MNKFTNVLAIVRGEHGCLIVRQESRNGSEVILFRNVCKLICVPVTEQFDSAYFEDENGDMMKIVEVEHL